MTTYVYTVAQGALIQAAFEKMGVFNDQSPAQLADVATATRQLNMFIKYLMIKNFNLWCYQDVSVALTQGQTTYPLGGSFAPWRPLRIPYARLQYANTNPVIEVPLTQLAREDYARLSQKGSQGYTNSYYYDPQLGQGVLYLYLTPDSTPNTVVVTCQRPLADSINGTDPLDFPIEWNDALVYGLAARLCFEYDVPENKAMRLESKAQQLLDDMLGWDQENASVRFSPDNWGYRRY